ncbi:ABC transporter ATP-binding protein [Parasphingopyxis sp.]|uniref:ABC transporter ATP-binding protein n=1 Tax=Parasphingopyxis sp. TaxID=1920299 RepID=UPI00261FA308|nr:ABC transporter ATP-binding protein [Parasphingopyxis sp.]
MTDPLLSARSLTKSWYGRPVLRDVDLDLRKGQVTAVLGPSGAGKSTLLRAIAGLERVDSGTIACNGELLTDGAVRVQPEDRNIGIVFQDFALFPHLTALGNVLFGLRRHPRSARRDMAMAKLAAVELAEKANAYPHTLSGGEQQRVALARALAPEPEIILLDEAFSGLDARLREALRETTLAALKASGAAVLIVTHDATEAMFMADELALMVDGAIIQSGPPASVYRSPVATPAARLLGEVNEWSGRVESGALVTPFGSLAAPGLVDGAAATALVRPEGVVLTSAEAGGYRIVGRHLLGASTVFAVAAPGGDIWQARMATAIAPNTDTVDITLDAGLASVAQAERD